MGAITTIDYNGQWYKNESSEQVDDAVGLLVGFLAAPAFLQHQRQVVLQPVELSELGGQLLL